MPASSVFTVTALTRGVKELLEGSFPYVWVRGQVVNLSRPSSGHVYFSLRDEESSLAAVWFKGNQRAAERFDPLTGEVYEGGPRPSLAATLENGQEVVCAGGLRVYGSRGVYQLVVELAQAAGRGRLYEEFERLREKLARLGYFAVERKRPLPDHPARVAVITAPQGAALQDFLRIAEGRGWGSTIRIHPAPMQGEAAPARIIAALEGIAAQGWAETVVIIRGGGSIEDLWAFNSEALARTIFSFPLPVLAGIGHEVDVTLADMTADRRAATPTHAAQLLWPDREELTARVAGLRTALIAAERRYVREKIARLERFAQALALRSPLRGVEYRQEQTVNARRLLQSAWARMLERRTDALERAVAAVRRAPQRLQERDARLSDLARRLSAARAGLFVQAEHSLERARLRLEAVNPHAPLDRGYALVRNAAGTFIRSPAMVSPGEPLRVVVRDGDFPVRVEGENT